MKKTFLFGIIITIFALAACNGKRPEGNTGETLGTLTGKTILLNSDIEIWKDSEKIYTGKADKDGLFAIENYAGVGNIVIKSCKGSFYSAGVQKEIAWNGCLAKHAFINTAADLTGHNINIVSSFVALWMMKNTDTKEWTNYLQTTALPIGGLETSLTDSTKIALWERGLSIVAKEISLASGITPETSLSTEVLVTKIAADLADNDTIDGSTKETLAALPVNEALIRETLTAAIPKVTNTFTETDLAAWLTHLKTAPAKFLGAGGENPDGLLPDDDNPNKNPDIQIVSPLKSSVVAGTIEIKAEATATSCTLISLSCILTYDTDKKVDITDTDSGNMLFLATLDTVDKNLPDTDYTLTCIGSNGVKTAEKTITFTLKNQNPVTIHTFITGPVTKISTISIKNAAGQEIKAITPDTEGNFTTTLTPGVYLFSTDGGTYDSAFIKNDAGDAPKQFTLDTALLSRATVEVNKSNKVYINALTTLREYIYTSLKTASDPKAETDSLDLLQKHFNKTGDINFYDEVVLGEPAINSNKLYFATAALDHLAMEISEEQSQSKTAFLLADLLKLLKKDIDGDQLFNGKDSAGDQIAYKKHAFDSYTLRHKAGKTIDAPLSLKRLLIDMNNDNHTKNTYSYMITAMSTDTCRLFPGTNTPDDLLAKDPKINNPRFKDYTGAIIEYNQSAGKIPYTNNAFSFLYEIGLNDGQHIGMYKITGDILKWEDVTATATEFEKLLYPKEEEKDKIVLNNITLYVEDTENNSTQFDMVAIKDSYLPVIDTLAAKGGITNNVPEPLFNTNFTLDYKITELNPLSFSYTVSLDGGTESGPVSIDTAAASGEISPTLSNDGLYTIKLTALDKAGNKGEKTANARLDKTAPAGDMLLKTQEQTPRTVEHQHWINYNDLKMVYENIVERDNSKITYSYTYKNGIDNSILKTFSTTTKGWESTENLGNLLESVVDTNDPQKRATLATKHTVETWMSDQAGNETDKKTIEFYVDSYVPILTINSAPTKPVNSYTFVYFAEENEQAPDNIKDVKYSVSGTIYQNVIIPKSGSVAVSCSGANSLPEGINTIIFTVEDYAGNKAEETRNFTLDCTPPLLNAGADIYNGTTLEQNDQYIETFPNNIMISSDSTCSIYYEIINMNYKTCTNGTARVVAKSCGVGNNGDQPQLCISNQWQNNGQCLENVPCNQNDKRNNSCGTNTYGIEEQTCNNGIWITTGTCADPAIVSAGTLPYTGNTVILPTDYFPNNGTKDGAYKLRVYAKDEAGNVTQDFIRTFTYDRTNPVIAFSPNFTRPVNPITEDAYKNISVSVTETNIQNCSYIVTNTVTNSPHDFFINEIVIPIRDNPEFIPTRHEPVYAYGNGVTYPPNTVTVQCTDKVGHTASKSLLMTYDIDAPLVCPPYANSSMCGVNKTYTNDTQVSITVRPFDNYSQYIEGEGPAYFSVPKVRCKYRYNAVPWIDCPAFFTEPQYNNVGTVTLTGLPDGEYEAQFVAEDISGNSGYSNGSYSNPYIVTWEIDTKAPLLRVYFGQNEFSTEPSALYVIEFPESQNEVNFIESVKAMAKGINGSGTTLTYDTDCTQGYPDWLIPYLPDSFKAKEPYIYTCYFESLNNTFDGNVFFKASDVFGNPVGGINFNDAETACSPDGSTPCLKRKLKIDANLATIDLTLDEQYLFVNGTQTIKFSFTTTGTVNSTECSIARWTGTFPNFQYTDVTSRFACSSGVLNSIQPSFYSSLNQGSYVVKVYAHNGVGTSTAFKDFTIDKTPPDLTQFTIQSPNSFVPFWDQGDKARIELNATDNKALASIKVDTLKYKYRNLKDVVTNNVDINLLNINGYMDSYIGTVQSNALNMNPGVYTDFRVTLTDKAGNSYVIVFNNTNLLLRGTNEETTITLNNIQDATSGVEYILATINRMKMDIFDNNPLKTALIAMPNNSSPYNGSVFTLDGWTDNEQDYAFCLNGSSYNDFINQFNDTNHTFGKYHTYTGKDVIIIDANIIKIPVPHAEAAAHSTYRKMYPLLKNQKPRIIISDNFDAGYTYTNFPVEKLFTRSQCDLPEKDCYPQSVNSQLKYYKKMIYNLSGSTPFTSPVEISLSEYKECMHL